jgi:hypothetical protein
MEGGSNELVDEEEDEFDENGGLTRRRVEKGRAGRE